ncbi:hypothetical protein KR009_009684 [Drosophila setifemur]|nr:hypothetical protein KR009_009684 [Drosophila setifemur]
MDNSHQIIKINQIISQSKPSNLRSRIAAHLTFSMPKLIQQRGGSLYCGMTMLGVVCLMLFRVIPGLNFGVYALVEPPQREGTHVPCQFFDTVNLTGHTRLPNGSYEYEDVIIPHNLVGKYNYIFKTLVDRVEVPDHVRGCICKVKPCLNLCCPWGFVYDGDACFNNTQDHRMWPKPELNVTFDGNITRTVNISEQFALQSFRPCAQMFGLQPEVTEYDAYLIFQNGSMLRKDDQLLLEKNQFCLVPTYVNETDLFYILNPANCDSKNDQSAVRIFNTYAMIFSVPFMLLTIAVYLLIPELRNQHGKSLVCYLMGLSVGYTTLCVVQFSREIEPDSMACKSFGYTSYTFFMAAYLWLNVISFDLWHNFRGTRGINRFQEKKRFLFYSLYAWGLAVVFLAFTLYAQEISDWPYYLKPGIGGGTFCWLDMTSWSALIYFYGPILVIVVANTVMFIMTAVKIHGVQREMARIIAGENSTKNLRTEKDKFGLFLRLFLIMGVTWTSELISYFVGNDKAWSKYFYISDLCNAMQGFLIFMLFVMKKKVKHLITNRLLKKKPSNGLGSATNSTSMSSDTSALPKKLNLKAVENPSASPRPKATI